MQGGPPKNTPSLAAPDIERGIPAACLPSNAKINSKLWPVFMWSTFSMGEINRHFNPEALERSHCPCKICADLRADRELRRQAQ